MYAKLMSIWLMIMLSNSVVSANNNLSIYLSDSNNTDDMSDYWTAEAIYQAKPFHSPLLHVVSIEQTVYSQYPTKEGISGNDASPTSSIEGLEGVLSVDVRK